MDDSGVGIAYSFALLQLLSLSCLDDLRRVHIIPARRILEVTLLNRQMQVSTSRK